MGKIDPRVVKTKRKLKEAFLILVGKQTLKEINVKDLTNLADVTRGTFYLHYKDKETFIQTMMSECLSDFFESIMINTAKEGEPAVYVCSLLNIFDYVEKRPDFFMTLLKEEDAIPYRLQMKDSFYKYIDDFVKNSQNSRNEKIPEKLLMNFFTYAFLGYLQGWINDGMMYANHFMAKNLYKLMNSQFIEEAGIAGFFVIVNPVV